MGPETIDTHPDLELPPDWRRLAEEAFPGYRVILGENFMKKSQGSYPPEWLVREMVQNFVDANPSNRGTLNGVSVQKEADEGGKKYTITGQWPFSDYNSIVELDSDKVEEEGLAGGNGIGLKQVALSLFRNGNGVTKFKIIGQGWEVDYKLVIAEDINRKLVELGRTEKTRRGFLMARVSTSQNQDACHYVIQTTPHSKIAPFLDRFHEFGVCGQNSSLQEMSYENEHGGFKWIPWNAVDDQDKEGRRGRLFINGQIFGFRDNYSEKESDYWGGPMWMTVRLNNLRYQMSLDRPAMRPDDLITYMESILNGMSQEDIIKNLKSCAYIWAGAFDYSKFRFTWYGGHGIPFALLVIKKMVERLKDSFGFSPDDYQREFGDKKYYCTDSRLDLDRKEELEKDGYFFCPEFFEKIHMPHPPIVQKYVRGTKINREESVEEHKRALLKVSETKGLPVSFESSVNIRSINGLADAFCRTLPPPYRIVIDVVKDHPEIVGFHFDFSVNTDVLIDLEQEPLFQILKGIIYGALSRQICEEAVLCSRSYESTFEVDAEEERLFIVNSESSQSTDGSLLQLTFPSAKKAQELREILRKATTGEARTVRRTRRLAAAAILAVIGSSATYTFWKHDSSKVATSIKVVPSPEKVDRPTRPRDPDSVTDVPIPSGPRDHDSIRKELASILGRFNDAHILPSPTAPKPPIEKDEPHHVSGLKIKNPTAEQRTQVQLLHEYFFLTTGIRSRNQFVIYEGKGAKGINFLNGIIGLHQSLFAVQFEEAIAVFVHEITHEEILSHREAFSHMQAALAAARERSLLTIGNKTPRQRDENEQRILDIRAEWNRLRSQK